MIDDILTLRRTEVMEGNAIVAGFTLNEEKISPRDLCVDASAKFQKQHPQRKLQLE
ncbi:MAG: hypothetical protein R3A47_10925 [Polyangiales bacterium]